MIHFLIVTKPGRKLLFLKSAYKKYLCYAFFLTSLENLILAFNFFFTRQVNFIFQNPEKSAGNCVGCWPCRLPVALSECVSPRWFDLWTGLSSSEPAPGMKSTVVGRCTIFPTGPRVTLTPLISSQANFKLDTCRFAYELSLFLNHHFL